MPGDPPTLHVVTPADWPLWRDARRAALTDAPHAFRARLADWHRGGEQQWRARLETPGTYNLVALLDGRTAGLARGVPGASDDCGGQYELHSVWVSPEARGRSVGDLLLTAVEDWARRSGAGALKLAVFPDNEPALALYHRHGYGPAQEPGALLPDGVTRELVLTKPLSTPPGR